MSTGQRRHIAARLRQSMAGRWDKTRGREANRRAARQQAVPGTMPGSANRPRPTPAETICNSETKEPERPRSREREARAYTRKNSLGQIIRRFRQEEYTNETLALDDSDETGVVKRGLCGIGGFFVLIWTDLHTIKIVGSRRHNK